MININTPLFLMTTGDQLQPTSGRQECLTTSITNPRNGVDSIWNAMSITRTGKILPRLGHFQGIFCGDRRPRSQKTCESSAASSSCDMGGFSTFREVEKTKKIKRGVDTLLFLYFLKSQFEILAITSRSTVVIHAASTSAAVSVAAVATTATTSTLHILSRVLNLARPKHTRHVGIR